MVLFLYGLPRIFRKSFIVVLKIRYINSAANYIVMVNEKAIFAAGCFWHVEDVFSKVNGVVQTRVGYTGGSLKNPAYKEVSSGKTGHAEAVEVIFNPHFVSYGKLLGIFWDSHDPTTPNRQGPDVGTNYRSAVFYLDDAQKKAAFRSRDRRQEVTSMPIVTEIVPASEFYPAEPYHQQYFQKHKPLRACSV
jgi:peptide-methionine (S)-S-oxide reductase